MQPQSRRQVAAAAEGQDKVTRVLRAAVTCAGGAAAGVCFKRPEHAAAVVHEALERATKGLLGCALLLVALRPRLVLHGLFAVVVAVLAWTVVGCALDLHVSGAVRDGSYFTAMVPGYSAGWLDAPLGFARLVFLGNHTR